MSKAKSIKLGYSLKLALNGLFKNRVMTFSSVLVLFSCLVIMGSFLLVAVNVNENVNKIDGYNKIVVFAEKDTNDYDLELMREALERIDGIESVEFKSNEESLEEQLSEYNLQSEFLLEMYRDDNPLKDSFVLTYEPNASVETIKLHIDNTVDHVAKYNINMDVVTQINGLKNAFAIIASWLMILLFVVSIFVIINTVKLSVYARRDEIALMRYIGATDLFISLPYLIEGLIIGIVSAALAFGAQFLLYKYLMLDLIGRYDIITIIPFAELRSIIILGFTVIGIAMGFTGSIISLKKYNKENA
ncbi:MAG: permease-like cell division protein FtsX [Clostridia bacterium]|nr:permease-like cell division protein FtsX [Clostridia bacterium]